MTLLEFATHGCFNYSVLFHGEVFRVHCSVVTRFEEGPRIELELTRGGHPPVRLRYAKDHELPIKGGIVDLSGIPRSRTAPKLLAGL